MFTFFTIYMASFVAVPVFMESLYAFRLSLSSDAQLDAHIKEPTFSELYGMAE